MFSVWFRSHFLCITVLSYKLPGAAVFLCNGRYCQLRSQLYLLCILYSFMSKWEPFPHGHFHISFQEEKLYLVWSSLKISALELQLMNHSSNFSKCMRLIGLFEAKPICHITGLIQKSLVSWLITESARGSADRSSLWYEKEKLKYGREAKTFISLCMSDTEGGKKSAIMCFYK